MGATGCYFYPASSLVPLSDFAGLSECHYLISVSRFGLSSLGKLPLTLVKDENSVSGIILSPFGTRLATLKLNDFEAKIEGEPIVHDPNEVFVAIAHSLSTKTFPVIGPDFTLWADEECARSSLLLR